MYLQHHEGDEHVVVNNEDSFDDQYNYNLQDFEEQETIRHFNSTSPDKESLKHTFSYDDHNSFKFQALKGQETTRHLNSSPHKEIPASKYKYTFYDWFVKTCRVVESYYFQSLILALIIVNTIMMGIATMDMVTDYSYTWEIFHRIDMLFMIIFTIEISMQFVYRGKALFNDIWLSCDFMLILLSWIFIIIPGFREFRALRAFRLIVKFKEMRNLVSALVVATRKILAVGMLLLLIFYVFGVIFTLLFKDLQEDGYTDEDYFSRLDKTFFTLFQFMTLDGWSDITKEVLVPYPWAWIPIFTFILISSFVVINLFIAVICDSVSEVQRREFEQNIMQINSKLSMVEDNKAAELAHLEDKVDQLQQVILDLRNELKQHRD